MLDHFHLNVRLHVKLVKLLKNTIDKRRRMMVVMMMMKQRNDEMKMDPRQMTPDQMNLMNIREIKK